MNLSALKPRYSLRAILVLMTLLALWCAYSMNWIRQRRAAIEDGWVIPVGGPAGEEPWAPGWLWMFGEPGYKHLWIVPAGPDIKDRFQEAALLFPESHGTGLP